MSLTASTYGARDHARAQAGARVPSQPTLPAGAAADLPAGVAPQQMLWEETVGGGGYCAHRLPRGARLRLLDLEGDACAGLVVYNALAPAERLNLADTVKVQWSAYLGLGSLLLSDMGRVLMTIVEDTSGRHDALCGASSRRTNAARYGAGAADGPHPSARDRFLLALAKHGLSARDLPANLNLFKGVRVAADGGLRFLGEPAPGAHVTLRAEVDALVVLANAPHRLDPRPGYNCGPLRVSAWQGPPTRRDDPFRLASPEAVRAFENTDDLLLGLGQAR